jgi:hypothetical protein
VTLPSGVVPRTVDVTLPSGVVPRTVAGSPGAARISRRIQSIEASLSTWSISRTLVRVIPRAACNKSLQERRLIRKSQCEASTIHAPAP